MPALRFNLQWLSIVPFVIGLWILLAGIGNFFYYIGKSDLGPLIAYANLYDGFSRGGIIILLSGLVFLAFRNMSITFRNN